MKRLLLIAVAVAGLLLTPYAAIAATPDQPQGAPPVAQSLVREGDYAMKLAPALGLGSPGSEAAAENMLAAVGISPRNGWIADYPVTPDIVGEIQESINLAANTGKISMKADAAVKAMWDVSAALGLPVREARDASVSREPNTTDYTNPTIINNYYNEEGPPAVTYYPPPPDYYWMYTWCPYPFWWDAFFFPGFFILTDFHIVVIRDRDVRVVSNVVIRDHKAFRVDPVRRHEGRDFLARVSGRAGAREGGFRSVEARKGAERIMGRGAERSSRFRGSEGVTARGTERGGFTDRQMLDRAVTGPRFEGGGRSFGGGEGFRGGGGRSFGGGEGFRGGGGRSFGGGEGFRGGGGRSFGGGEGFRGGGGGHGGGRH